MSAPALCHPRRDNKVIEIVFFVAIVSTALALGGGLAHLFELPAKMALPGEQYFIVQGLYRGWWQLVYPLALQLFSLVALVVAYRHEPRVFFACGLSLMSLLAAQVVFWVFTAPANSATSSWTAQPENWETLRRQWEYSHAAGAVLQLLAMASLAVAALSRK